MIDIYGKPLSGGIAIAVPAVIDAQQGINGISPALLQQGIKSITRRAPQSDYPQAVLVCENLALGIGLRLPGISASAIIAQSEDAPADFTSDLPCIVGLDDLMNLIRSDEIIIVDGNKGVIYIDPDPQTLIHYQQIEDQKKPAPRILIGSQHMPAVAQTGQKVLVFANVSSKNDLSLALDNGADGLLVDIREDSSDLSPKAVLYDAAGLPVWFIADEIDDEFIRAVLKFAMPDQVIIIFAPENFEKGVVDVTLAYERAADELYYNGNAGVNVGKLLDQPDIFVNMNAIDFGPAAIEFNSVKNNLDNIIPFIDKTCIIIINDNLVAIKDIIDAGIGSIAVKANMVLDAKDFIRRTGLEDEV